MKITGFELGVLTVVSCLFGMAISLFNASNMITADELAVAGFFYFVVVLVFCVAQTTKRDDAQYPLGHKSAAPDPHLRALEESYRHQLLGLKHGHKSTVLHLQSQLHVADFKFMHLNADYDWITTLYQDQSRLVQEHEDRIAYLERKLHESGQNTPTTRQPYSAPATQINFNAPPRRLSNVAEAAQKGQI